MVARRVGTPFAFVARCPHRGFSLADARIDRSTVRCPAHGYAWHPRSGEPVRCGRSLRPLVVVPVEVTDGRLVAHWTDDLARRAGEL